MNEDKHIIKFEYNIDLYYNFLKKDIIIINDDFYKSSKDEQYAIYIDIYYNNLHIYKFPIVKYNYKYMFNLSNMLYKLHTPDYYSKIHQNKGLI